MVMGAPGQKWFPLQVMLSLRTKKQVQFSLQPALEEEKASKPYGSPLWTLLYSQAIRVLHAYIF